MNRSLKSVIALLCAVLIVVMPASYVEAAEKNTSVEAEEPLTPVSPEYDSTELFERSAPACVEVRVTDSFDQVYVGSGFFVGKYNVLTNAHVIANASRIQIFGIDGKEYTVRSIYGFDEVKDLALIRVKEKNKKYLKFGDVPPVGTDIYSIGNPLGIVGTYSKGMISNSLRVIDDNDYVQLDIPSGIGVGGAPVFDSTGAVIGVMCLTVPSASYLNLAIRSDIVVEFLDGLKKKDRISTEEFYDKYKNGKVTPNVIGLVEGEDYKYTKKEEVSGLTEKTAAQIYEEGVDAITNIIVLAYDGFGYSQYAGTGCFISKDKLITAYHVVKDCLMKNIYVYDKAGNRYEVKEMATSNEEKDIAILTVKLLEYAPDGEDFTPNILPINKDYVPATGEEVFSLGNPQSYSFSLAKGIVRIPTITIDGVDYVFHQAPTSPGSSGGVLLNKYGQIIAVTNMILLGTEFPQALNMCVSTMVKNAPLSALGA